MIRLRPIGLSALTVVALLAHRSAAADAPAVQELRTQRVGAVTYFRVRLARPADLRLPSLIASGDWSEGNVRSLCRFPRLVPQDRVTRDVYPRLDLPERQPGPVRLAGDGSMEFVGRCPGQVRAARLLLLYPRADDWGEATLQVDLAAATAGDDLQRLWALAQAGHFACLEAQTSAPGFFTFAREAMSRKYGVRVPAVRRRANGTDASDLRRLYELTIGAEAIDETLQFQRLLAPETRDRGPRSVPIDRVPGIDLADAPWETMNGGKKPAVEPLAHWAPPDWYYVHFKNLRKFLEMGELMDRWGGRTLRVYQVSSREQYVRRRYEKQLCLRDTPLIRKQGPLYIRGVAAIGSDPYLGEGTDVTLLFHVVSTRLFLIMAEQFIQEARTEFGADLKERKIDYHGVNIESFVTSLREISLYRAVVGDVVVCSNSLAAMRHVLDTKQGKHPALADAPGFQCMRSVFRFDDPKEDGFVFLSEPFIRQITGPANKIKEKRRLEALAGLRLAMHGALFTAWENGGLPVDQRALLAGSGLKPEEIDTPEGDTVFWDGRRGVAVSDVYNTLRFATPLLELPLDHITPTEERDYLRFRQEYQQLWGRVLAPVGMCVTQTDRQLRIETLVVPVGSKSLYKELRRWTGGNTTTLEPLKVPPQALAHFLIHLSPELRGYVAKPEQLGDWSFFRLDDSELYGQLAKVRVRQALEPANVDALEQEAERLLFQLPLVLGVRMGEPRGFDEMVRSFIDVTNLFLGPFTVEEMKPAYRGIILQRFRFTPHSLVAESLNDPQTPRERWFLPALYQAQVGGAWYLSPSEELLHDLIDRAQAPEKKSEAVAVNDALYVAPKAVVKAWDGLALYLEWEAHRRALSNAPLWQVLFHGGLLPEELSEDEMRAAALHYFGFVPLSPDEASYAYEPRTDDVVNARHGSRRLPVLRAGIEKDSPLGKLMAEFRSVRAELLFRNEGVQATMTIERPQPPQPKDR